MQIGERDVNVFLPLETRGKFCAFGMMAGSWNARAEVTSDTVTGSEILPHRRRGESEDEFPDEWMLR